MKSAFCWAHVRRGFIDLATKGAAPIAAEVLTRIAAQYRIEGESPGSHSRCDALRARSAAGRC